MFVEQVKYTEPYSLQLIGGDDQRLETFLAQKGLRTEDELRDSLDGEYHPKERPIVTPYPPEVRPYPPGVTPPPGGGYPPGTPPIPTPPGGGVLYPCGQVFIGFIGMYSGAIADIPECWSLCDGTPPTPDLRNRFIVSYGDKYNVGDTGGSDTVDISHLHAAGTLVADDESAHTHEDGTYTAANDTHNHADTFTIDNDAHTHDVTGSSAGESSHTHGDGSYLAANDSHNHALVGTSATEGSHTHADGSYGTGGPTTGAGHVVDFGADTTLLSKATFDAHTHDVSGTSAAGSAHSHNVGTYVIATDVHSHNVSGTSGAGSSHSHGDGSYAAASDTHNHGISGSVSNDTHGHDVTGTSGAGSAHGHTISGDTATGGSVALNVVPSYYALAFIMRTS